MSQPYSLDEGYKQKLLGNPTNDILSRYLDTVGNGSGTKDMAAAATNYYIQPPSGSVFVIDKIRISIEDDAPFNADGFGGGAVLVSGCLMSIQRSESEVVEIRDLLDGVPILSNGNLGAIGDLRVSDEAAGCVVQCDVDLTAPIRLSGNKSERLRFTTQVTLAGMTKVFVKVAGRMFADES